MSNTSLDTSTPHPEQDGEPVKFADYTSYRQAFLATLAQARSSLILCERDFSESPLGSLDAEALIQSFLTQPGNPQLRLLCFDVAHLAGACPRFTRLLDRFAHRLLLQRVDSEALCQWDKGFIVADGQHYLLRHHFDWPRGETGKNTSIIRQLERSFEEMWQISAPDLAWQRLSL
ncbi:DUF7931 domain-containing protein [Chitinilyticum piscinae]|uniref:DUF7931 domain-containing protein n=1 Tax=Chitinilyticum piscinae TaxID=2866724 RepID=A0A8J7FHY5_9NEIS|nr:hypothetical protein [Chitinilyticum piscinae]MBE9609783.1 hypothetical protein [Chitinilyticum piscinae]